MLTALTGFMGCGKSTVGRALAESLGVPFLDLDEIIEKRCGAAPADIIRSEGEAAFRRKEAAALKDTVARYGSSDAILSLGGGAVIDPASSRLVHDKTLCIYLRATVETLEENLQISPGDRPVLQGTSVAELLSARAPIYEAAAGVIIDIDGLTTENIVDEIIISVL
ncbi:MAG: shikimate kinase [Bacteroidales bacterium]|nr:shikimate kinase [Bacteroidales bacterium]